MKKRILALMIFIILSLCACSSAETVYTVVKNDISYVVDKEDQTISDGTHTYRYDFSGNSSSYNVKIIYPDGSSYWFEKSGYSGIGGWSDNYDEDRYVDGDTLCDVLLEKAPKESNPGKHFGAIILALFGLFNILSPYTAWYLEYGWFCKNAEPYDWVLGIYRVVGVIAVIVAVILLFT